MMQADDIESLDELCEYIETYADGIYVREEVDGEWGSHALTELPAEQAIEHTLRFIRERRVPGRVVDEEEI